MSDQPVTDDQITRAEKRLIGLVRTSVPIGDTALLWASAVGTKADVGVLAENEAGESHPIESIPNELIEQVMVHRELMYAHTGRTWVSLLVRVTPGGGAEFTLGRHDTLPWARPVTEDDWAEEARLHPRNARGAEDDAPAAEGEEPRA